MRHNLKNTNKNVYRMLIIYFIRVIIITLKYFDIFSFIMKSFEKTFFQDKKLKIALTG